jgi:hypothetical protein
MPQLTLAEHREVLSKASEARVAAGLSKIENLGSIVKAQTDTRKIDPWDHFYFRPVGEQLYQVAVKRSLETIRSSRGGKKTLVMSENSEVIGKVGELVFEEFCWYYYGAPTDFNEEQLARVNESSDYQHTIQAALSLYQPQVAWKTFVHQVQKGGDLTDFQIHGLLVDVKTRQLHTDVSIAPIFDLRIPKHELPKFQDVYVLAGYCPSSTYAYVLGWCSYEQVAEKELNTNVKYAAKCVPISELYRMDTLSSYLEERARAVGAG